VVLVNIATLRKAEALIESCEHCNPEGAEIPFDNILDRITSSDPSVTDYVLEAPAKCQVCRRDILEKTLIEPRLRTSSAENHKLVRVKIQLDEARTGGRCLHRDGPGTPM
jgi:hypothetical protein